MHSTPATSLESFQRLDGALSCTFGSLAKNFSRDSGCKAVAGSLSVCTLDVACAADVLPGAALW